MACHDHVLCATTRAACVGLTRASAPSGFGFEAPTSNCAWKALLVAPSELGKPRIQPRLGAATARKAPNWHFSHRNNTNLFISIGKREREQKRSIHRSVLSEGTSKTRHATSLLRFKAAFELPTASLPGGCARERAKPKHQRPVREAEPAQYGRPRDEDVWKGACYLLGPQGHPEHGAVHRRGCYRQNQARTDGSRHSTALPGAQNALCGLVFGKPVKFCCD